MSNVLLDIERLELTRVLLRRAMQLSMRETLLVCHKSPYLQPGQWELMLETYRLCFPGDWAPAGPVEEETE